VLSSDGEGQFPVTGTSRAGSYDDVKVTVGTVVYITTGAVTKFHSINYTPPPANHWVLVLPQARRSPMALMPWCRLRTPSRCPTSRTGRRRSR
jgi:hypothetical protein